VHVFVKMLSTRKAIVLDVETTDTVEIVKKIVEIKEGIPAADQNLYFAGALLEDSDVLAEKYVQVGHDSTLELTSPLLGGGSGGVEVS